MRFRVLSWSADRPARRALAAAAALACAATLAAFWTTQGQFRGWQRAVP
jgi:hypothetical protein